jgi:hypothetical protein
MPSEIEKRRKIDAVLSPPIERANKLAAELKTKSDLLESQLKSTRELLSRIKSKEMKLAIRRAIAKRVVSKKLIKLKPIIK